jgi:hypothetical protein
MQSFASCSAKPHLICKSPHMRTQKDRLSAIGIVALAAIAVLGWIRQPVAIETREQRGPLTLDELTVTRKSRTAEIPETMTTLPRWHDTRDEGSSIRISEPQGSLGRSASQSAAAVTAVPRAKTAAKAAQTSPRERAKLAEPIRPDRGRPNLRDPDSPADREQRTVTRDRREDVEDLGKPSPSGVSSTPSSKNSKMRTVAIIAGSTAAGAVIGGLTGGGKGAAIGAGVGAAGGYIYDRVRRDGDDSYNQNGGSTSTHGSGQPENDLVSRYGSPSFLGR